MVTDATFEKVTLSDKPLYGPEKLILCGFSAAVQPKFEAVSGHGRAAKGSALSGHWTTSWKPAFPNWLTLPSGAGRGESSTLPRAIIVAGITERQLQTLMTVCRKTGMQQALWATLTPTSETWLLKDLLAELAAERKALQNNTSQK